MEHSHEELWLQIRQLQQELADLRRRVLALEPAHEPLVPELTAAVAPPPPLLGIQSLWEGKQARAVPSVLGRALLGLSGAYLLRALAGSGAIPVLAGSIAAIAFAVWWIFLAAREAAENRLASGVYSLTALLIVSPLMWEATIRFHALDAPLASAILVCFTILALSIAWRHRITAIAVVATWGGLLTSTAIFRETHDAAAWTASVLAIAAVVELSACRDHWLSLRWAAAIFADTAILIVTMLALQNTSEGSGGAGVTARLALAGQASLLGIYLASTADRTLIRRLRITGFETAQAAAAFVTAIGGALYLGELTSLGNLPVGLFTLLCSLACYGIAHGVVSRDRAQDRNFYVYSGFGAALIVIGWRVLLPATLAPAAWALFAPVLSVRGFITGRSSLRWHAAILLVLATAASGSVRMGGSWLIQADAATIPAPRPAYASVLISSLLCYAAILRSRRKTIPVPTVEALVPAVIFAWLASGLIAWPLAYLRGDLPLRTALLAGVAALAARAGVMTSFREFWWVTYLWLAALTYKLFFTDLRFGSTFDTAASLTIAGVTLLLLPKLLRASRKDSAALSANA